MSWVPGMGTIVLIACVLYVPYYLFFVVRRTSFFCGKTRFRSFLQDNCGQFLDGFFWVPFWCISSNVQSLFAMLIQDNQPELPYRRQLKYLSDGGLVALDWLNEDCEPPVVLCLTGLTGDSQAFYLKTLLPMLSGMKCPCVVLNNRGQGGLPLLNHRMAYVLGIDDVTEVVAEIKKRYPEGRILAVGYSLGGTQLGHYLRQKGDEAQIDAGVSLSIPFHLPTTNVNLNGWSTNYLLNMYLARSLVQRFKQYCPVLVSSGIVDIKHLFRSRTLVEIDKQLTVPVYGFKSTSDYYEKGSLKGKLSTIRRPLVFLLSSDDVFGSEETIPTTEIEDNPWLAAIVTPRGGHVGFLDGLLWPKPPFFSERFVAAYLKALLQLCRKPGGTAHLAQLGTPCTS